MNVLLCEMIYLLIDLLELPIYVILSNYFVTKLFLLRVILELFIVHHKLLSLSILDDARSRSVLMIYDFFTSLWRSILDVTIFINIRKIFKNGVRVFVVKPIDLIVFVSSLDVGVTESLMLPIHEIQCIFNSFVLIFSCVEAIKSLFIVLY